MFHDLVPLAWNGTDSLVMVACYYPLYIRQARSKDQKAILWLRRHTRCSTSEDPLSVFRNQETMFRLSSFTVPLEERFTSLKNYSQIQHLGRTNEQSMKPFQDSTIYRYSHSPLTNNLQNPLQIQLLKNYLQILFANSTPEEQSILISFQIQPLNKLSTRRCSLNIQLLKNTILLDRIQKEARSSLERNVTNLNSTVDEGVSFNRGCIVCSTVSCMCLYEFTHLNIPDCIFSSKRK